MEVTHYEFGRIVIDGKEYTRDIIIRRGQVEKRKKKNSKVYKGRFGHTPLSAEENIPWNSRKLIVGTGMSEALPIMREVEVIAGKKGVEITAMPTAEAIRHINDRDTNLILHLTC